MRILLITLLSVGLTMTNLARAESAITIATGEWAPWTGAELSHHGFVNHVVAEAFADQGYAVQFEYYPWARAYHLVEAGQKPVASYVYASGERQRTVLYSDAITEEQIVFFVLKGQPFNVTGLEDLTGYIIGVTRGNTYTDEFRQMIDDGVLKADMANSDVLNFRKLLSGRIDVLPASRLQGLKVLRNNFDPDVASQVDVLDFPLSRTTGHLMFSKEHPDAAGLKDAFNRGLAAVRASGTYDTLYNRMLEGGYDAPE